VPLADIDPNVCRRLRSGSTTTQAAPQRPTKRPRGHPPTLYTPIELLEQCLPKEPHPLGCPQGRPRSFLIIDELPIETLCPQGCPTTLLIYQDPDSDYETPLRAGS